MIFRKIFKSITFCIRKILQIVSDFPVRAQSSSIHPITTIDPGAVNVLWTFLLWLAFLPRSATVILIHFMTEKTLIQSFYTHSKTLQLFKSCIILFWSVSFSTHFVDNSFHKEKFLSRVGLPSWWAVVVLSPDQLMITMTSTQRRRIENLLVKTQ